MNKKSDLDLSRYILFLKDVVVVKDVITLNIICTNITIINTNICTEITALSLVFSSAITCNCFRQDRVSQGMAVGGCQGGRQALCRCHAPYNCNSCWYVM